MAQAARPVARQRQNPSLAPPPPPPPPASARGGGAQDTACPTCGDRVDLRNITHCQCKKAPGPIRQNEVRHANEAMLKRKGISRPDSSEKYGLHKSSGGRYSKPDARVKLIPAEEITYAQPGKSCGRTVGSVGLHKRHCRRSVTPPDSRKVCIVKSTVPTQKPMPPPRASPATSYLSPNRLERSATPPPSSRKVSTVRSALLTQKPMPPPPASPVTPCLSPKTLESAEKRHPLVGGYSTSPLTQVSSLLKRPSPFCKAFPSETSRTSLNTAAAEPSSKNVCTPAKVKLCPTSCNLGTLQCQRKRGDAAPTVQKNPTVDHALVSPISVLSERLSERSTEVCPDGRSGPSSRTNLFDAKCKIDSLQCEANITPIQCPQPTTPAQCVVEDFEAVPSTKRHISTETQTNQQSPINCTPVILHTKLHKKHYQPEACWKGKFEVIGELTHTFSGLEAHFSFTIAEVVREASKQMPGILKLEALPLSRLWPKTFKLKPPDGQDIGLCFVSSPQRPNGNYDNLLENISTNIGLRTSIGTLELLIFSSKLLTEEYQEKCGKFYFWGVFQRLRKKQNKSRDQTNNMEIGKNLDLTDGRSCEIKTNKCGIGMALDATEGSDTERDKSKEIGKILEAGGKEIDREICGEIGNKLDVTGVKENESINEYVAITKTPDPNAAVSCSAPAASFSPNSADSTCQSATRAPADSDLVLDTPSGFPLGVPPGFTEAQSHGLLTGVPDVPPGFTEDHRLPTVTEKKPLIKFSLNVPRLVQTEVPPGFSKLVAVKKEPGLPAIYEATEERTSMGKKVDEIKTTHAKVIVEGDESSEERRLPKTRLISDILRESSCATSNEYTSTSPNSAPRNCRSTNASSSDRFQEMEAPEKQNHPSKRALQERCGSSNT